MKAVRIHDSLAYRVHRAARLLRRHFLDLATRNGLDITPEQWFILNKLSWDDGVTPSELCESIFSDRPNMTRLLAGLEAKRLVRRATDAGDGRKTRIYLTRAGREMNDRFAALVPDARRTLFAGIRDEELQVVARVLQRLEDNIGD